MAFWSQPAQESFLPPSTMTATPSHAATPGYDDVQVQPPALAWIDLDRLIETLVTELGNCSAEAQRSFDERLVQRSRRVLPVWVVQSMGLDVHPSAQAMEALLPTSLVELSMISLEASVWLQRPVRAGDDATVPVRMQMVSSDEAPAVSAETLFHFRLVLDAASRGEVYLGEWKADVADGKRNDVWRLWESSPGQLGTESAQAAENAD